MPVGYCLSQDGANCFLDDGLSCNKSANSNYCSLSIKTLNNSKVCASEDGLSCVNWNIGWYFTFDGKYVSYVDPNSYNSGFYCLSND